MPRRPKCSSRSSTRPLRSIASNFASRSSPLQNATARWPVRAMATRRSSFGWPFTLVNTRPISNSARSWFCRRRLCRREWSRPGSKEGRSKSMSALSGLASSTDSAFRIPHSALEMSVWPCASFKPRPVSSRRTSASWSYTASNAFVPTAQRGAVLGILSTPCNRAISSMRSTSRLRSTRKLGMEKNAECRLPIADCVRPRLVRKPACCSGSERACHRQFQE